MRYQVNQTLNNFDKLYRPESISYETLAILIKIYGFDRLVCMLVDFAYFDKVIDKDGKFDKVQAAIISEKIHKKNANKV